MAPSIRFNSSAPKPHLAECISTSTTSPNSKRFQVKSRNNRKASQLIRTIHFSLTGGRERLTGLVAGSAEASETQVSLTTAQLEKIKIQFKLADLDSNGLIDLEELRKLLESTEEGMAYSMDSWLPEAQLQKIMDRYDSEKKGSLTFEQFVQFSQANILLQGTLQEYEKIFQATDTSGNGKIGFSELSDFFESIGSPMTDEQLANIMMEYDIDKNGYITFTEFLLFFQNQLLELQSVLKYIQDIDYMREPRKAGVEEKEGSVSTIFAEGEFDEIIEKNKDSLVIVFAGLTWCRPCKAVMRPYQNLAAKYPRLRFVKFFGNANASTKQLFTTKLKAKATPAFFFFRNGEMIHSHTGKDKLKLENYIKINAYPEELLATA